MKQALRNLAMAITSLALAGQAFGVDGNDAKLQRVGNVDLQATIDSATGLPADIATRQRHWFSAPAAMTVKREATGVAASPAGGSAVNETSVRASLASLGLVLSSRWSQDQDWLVWDLEFTGDRQRSGHEVILELPVLKPSLSVFTPSDRGVQNLEFHPTFKPVAYGVNAWNSPNGETYVLPLVSIFDPANDSALTIALPPDRNIPHLQVEWKDARTLRITLAHRGMGGGKASPLRILFATHAADYRSALAAYSHRYPAYFETPVPRSDHEGAFYYHHIQEHPDYMEMQRQNVSFIWSSFWFTHLGNYLPAEKEWFPWTYANWWRLGKKMSDGQINTFVEEMHQHRIAMFAYFN
ncbi:MAG: hypothetical protein NT154_26960, partial [Verrucomicrobia bacterium]|nr:hypothetical protein [Verrucomicrobiota bacterium]